MNSIELTQQHKDKLLEMCNTLFPDENRILTTDSQYLIHKSDNYKKIHWFEFCMTHLPKILFEKLVNKEYSSNEELTGDDLMFERWNLWDNYFKEMKGLGCWINPEHPVDYLYEQFKKLKKYENS